MDLGGGGVVVVQDKLDNVFGVIDVDFVSSKTPASSVPIALATGQRKKIRACFDPWHALK